MVRDHRYAGFNQRRTQKSNERHVVKKVVDVILDVLCWRCDRHHRLDNGPHSLVVMQWTKWTVGTKKDEPCTNESPHKVDLLLDLYNICDMQWSKKQGRIQGEEKRNFAIEALDSSCGKVCRTTIGFLNCL